MKPLHSGDYVEYWDVTPSSLLADVYRRVGGTEAGRTLLTARFLLVTA
jgi:hypothetical protein